ncbi:4'-phosphopantetheinyl transferase family protein [Deinococcus pimensis]|uniref:4'-phosphopantetheinyl transferase family protein n=1 Tax=Deinococcus pimensis TaxID=309888 RepID=UPI0004B383F9|nr:4'-phosphopantetheinyl transferase superfamily protein [Deinococcus pimensis]
MIPEDVTLLVAALPDTTDGDAGALVRRLLAAELGLPAADVPLARLPGGRPVLTGAHAALGLSVTHTTRLVAVALARGHDVGVDAEERAEVPGATSVARRFFHPHEHRAFLALPAHERADAFTRVWTRREAVLKALGVGLAAQRERVEVYVDARTHDWLVHADGTAAGWRTVDLTLDGHVGALALREREDS